MTLANTTGIHSTMVLYIMPAAVSGNSAGCDFLHLQRHLCGESKVEGGAYVNNANVDKINSILLQVCEEQATITSTSTKFSQTATVL